MQTLTILFIGDVVGRPGRRAVHTEVPKLKRTHGVDLVIANVENAAGGFGVTAKVVEELHASGVDLMTTGNHVWDKRESYDLIDETPYLLRPLNYPPGVPGRGSLVYQGAGWRLGLVNLSGRVFIPGFDDPFRAVNSLLQTDLTKSDLILVDFHAEATAEKVAMGWYLDGKVAAVVGTHTHVQTADARILPKGTAYITDLGMTGPLNSVLGMDRDIIINKFLTQMPTRFEVESGPYTFQGVVITYDLMNRRSVSIERIFTNEQE